MSGNVVIPYTGDTESNSVLQFNWSMLALVTNGISEIGWRLTPSKYTVKYVLIRYNMHNLQLEITLTHLFTAPISCFVPVDSWSLKGLLSRSPSRHCVLSFDTSTPQPVAMPDHRQNLQKCVRPASPCRSPPRALPALFRADSAAFRVSGPIAPISSEAVTLTARVKNIGVPLNDLSEDSFCHGLDETLLGVFMCLRNTNACRTSGVKR